MTAPIIHPRLRKIAPDLGKHLQLTDAVELDAALDDIQTLLYRCSYHLDLARAQRGWRQTKRRGARRATRETLRNPSCLSDDSRNRRLCRGD